MLNHIILHSNLQCDSLCTTDNILKQCQTPSDLNCLEFRLSHATAASGRHRSRMQNHPGTSPESVTTKTSGSVSPGCPGIGQGASPSCSRTRWVISR